MMNVVGAELLLDALSSISSLGSHKHMVTNVKRLGESHRASPLGTPETLAEPLDHTTSWKRLWEGGAPSMATLPVSLVEPDAWSRAAPGKMGHDVCDAAGGYAGQTKPHNPTYSHESKEFGDRCMISVGFRRDLYLPPAWRVFSLRVSEKENGWVGGGWGCNATLENCFLFAQESPIFCRRMHFPAGKRIFL